MSQMTAERLLGRENVAPPVDAAMRWSNLLIGVGGVGVVATIAGSFVLGPSRALAAWHVGAMSALAMCLGAMFWVMVFHLTGAGWSVTLRRQFENLMGLMPVALALVAPVLIIELFVTHGSLFEWMNPDHTAGDLLYEHKRVYLSSGFFIIRWGVYILVWMILVTKLIRLSTAQDKSGDASLTLRARFTSSWGMLAFALTTAFAAFDWLMSLDYEFFSTMWGVYFFAGGVSAAPCVIALVFYFVQRTGRAQGLVTREHRHDLGKLMFGFCVFWAYIGFSQYFLIWYSNLPEETAFMRVRQTNGYMGLTVLLVVGHFVLPFLILLFVGIKRSAWALPTMAVWLLLMHAVDIYWIVRPEAHALGEAGRAAWSAGSVWLDVAGVVGAWGLFFGALCRRVAGGPLIPIRDPRLAESLRHRNYV